MGRTIRLDPLEPGDYSELMRLELQPDVASRWRNQGRSISPQAFHEGLWADVLDNRVVRSNRDSKGRLLGTVTAYQPNLRDGTAYLAVVIDPRLQRTGVGVAAVALHLQYLFRVWPLRKVYAEVHEFNYRQFASGAGRYFEVEGRLREHTYLSGRYWDLLLLSTTREAFAERVAPLLPQDTSSE